jgi:hypothetical protein
MVFQQCHGQTDSLNFHAERISGTASITIKQKIDTVFSLFGAFEERKWAEGWNPRLVYPDKEIMEEGTTFKTPGHSKSEPELLWIVAKYQPDRFLVQYLVLSTNRFWTIRVTCNSIDPMTSGATISYTFTGLNEEGNKKNERSLRGLYQHDLKDWEEAINYYLTHGQLLNHQ